MPGQTEIVAEDAPRGSGAYSLSLLADGETMTFPVQVDGDYIGDHTSLELGVDPGALTVIA